MGEHIFRISVQELQTIRIKSADGTITEMPIENLQNYAKRQPNAYIADALAQLGQALAHLSKDDVVEFVIPLDPRES